jgi:hypothetical protein
VTAIQKTLSTPAQEAIGMLRQTVVYAPDEQRPW